MSKDADRADYLSGEHLDHVDDWRLPGEVLGQRLMDVVRAEELKNEAAGKAQPDVLSAL